MPPECEVPTVRHCRMLDPGMNLRGAVQSHFDWLPTDPQRRTVEGYGGDVIHSRNREKDAFAVRQCRYKFQGKLRVFKSKPPS
jgi:hypothetical protein